MRGAQTTLQGKSNALTTDKNIVFLADSDATEHIINTGFILSNLKKSSGAVIQSANKYSSADIKINGRRDLIINKKNSLGEPIILKNVLAAENISENLLSLRKFVDLGLSIYLDDEQLKIFDKETGEEYLTGVCNKPNWNIYLEIVNSKESLEGNCQSYRFSAKMITMNEQSPQSQSEPDLILEIHNSENNSEAEFGRERIQTESESGEDSKSLGKFLNYKIVDIDSLEESEEVDDLFISFELEKLHTEKLDEGMLWHVRLGHPSLEYLKKLQKLDENLKNVKFNENIKNCETCILAKLTKPPFSETRTRAQKPLYMIHVDTIDPIKPISYPDQKRFIIVFVDDFFEICTSILR